MVDTLSPLTRSELRQLLARIDTFQAPPTQFLGLDGIKLVKLLLYTGMHPSVICRPDRVNLHLNGNYLDWKRPKNGRAMHVPLDPAIREWVGEFLDENPRYSMYTANRLIHLVGAHCGLPELSPRTLRHTFLRVYADRTHDLDDLMRVGGCTMQVALGYIRSCDTERDDPIINEGLFGGKKEGA